MGYLADKALMELLITRLERISVDSYWAHRASGVRGALIRIVDGVDEDHIEPSIETDQIINFGYYVLEQAAIKKIGLA